MTDLTRAVTTVSFITVTVELATMAERGWFTSWASDAVS